MTPLLNNQTFCHLVFKIKTAIIKSCIKRNQECSCYWEKMTKTGKTCLSDFPALFYPQLEKLQLKAHTHQVSEMLTSSVFLCLNHVFFMCNVALHLLENLTTTRESMPYRSALALYDKALVYLSGEE